MATCRQHLKIKGIKLRSILVGLVLGSFLGSLVPVTPALAQVGAPPVMEKPAAPPAEAAPAGAPTTCGPMISDTCLPIETGKFAMQAWWALSLYPGVFTQNWRHVTAGG